MGFWHLIFGIFGGGDGAVSVNAIESDNVHLIWFSQAAVVYEMQADADVRRITADAHVIDFTG